MTRDDSNHQRFQEWITIHRFNHSASLKRIISKESTLRLELTNISSLTDYCSNPELLGRIKVEK